MYTPSKRRLSYFDVEKYDALSFRVTYNGPTATRKRQALELSITKWWFTWDYLKEHPSVLDDGGDSTCQLCQLYFHERGSCRKCPYDCGLTYTNYGDNTSAENANAVLRELQDLHTELYGE
jgi:hypothetical protein